MGHLGTACRNMKALNVKVYSIGFRLDDPIAETVLRNCATSGVIFYRAESGEELRKAFRSIAEGEAWPRAPASL